jgi:alpha-ketoglutarate-dependent taurine dioxygenase
MSLTFTRLGGCFFAEASTIDLRTVYERDTLEQIRAGMDEHAVLVFRDQAFSDADQLDFAQRFDGTLHAKTSTSVLTKNRFGNEALTDVSNVNDDEQHDARRSLWLKEFLEKYFQSQRKPTSSPTSVPTAAVPVPAPNHDRDHSR